jgi:hypothetical protein
MNHNLHYFSFTSFTFKMAIDNALKNVGLQRIVNYPYIVGDCFFDSITYLLHGIVCNITL